VDDLKFPVGRFDWNAPLSSSSRAAAIEDIAQLPTKLAAALAGLDQAQIGTPYRPGGWTVAQVANHIADSHVNGYIRVKLALTEDRPTIKPYDQAQWAGLADGSVNPAISLRLLESLHARWTTLLRALSEADFARELNHPENGVRSIDRFVHLYGWHSRHHVAHIMTLRVRQGW
jgi:hypothetical protein